MQVSQEPADSLLDTTAAAPSPDAPDALATRIHYLDNLRALAMLLGVYLHGALAHAEPAQSVWLATDPGSSVVIDVSIWFIHLFRMGLFFVLSGYFAKLVIERKSLRYFLRSRCLRIALPFLVFYPLLVIFPQTLLVPYSWSVGVKRMLILLGTLLPGLITYLVFVRYTPLSWMLHGKRTFP